MPITLAMPEGEYRALPDINQSSLKIIEQYSPRHFHYNRVIAPGALFPDTPALIFGRAFHLAVLEPANFLDGVCVAPDVDRRTKAGKQLYAEFLAENGHKTRISADDMEDITAMVDAVMGHEWAAKLMTGEGHNEVVLQWVDGGTGTPCKGRADRIKDGWIIDVKSSQSAKPEAFRTEAA